MTSLKLAIERALERRAAGPAAQLPPSSLPVTPLDTTTTTTTSSKVRSVAQELEELRKVPSSHGQQLHTLRGHFESCITQPSRYVDQHQLSRWTRGMLRVLASHCHNVHCAYAGQALEIDKAAQINELGCNC